MQSIEIRASRTAATTTSKARLSLRVDMLSLCVLHYEGWAEYRIGEHDSRMGTINEIMVVSTKPIILDGSVNIVIYANQLIRNAFHAMMKTATSILDHHRAKEADERLMRIKEILTLIPEEA